MRESPECRLFPRGTQLSLITSGARAGRRGQQRPDQVTSAGSPGVGRTLRRSSHFIPYQDGCQAEGRTPVKLWRPPVPLLENNML